MESVECAEEPDHSKCDYVHPGWYSGRMDVEMERVIRWHWLSCVVELLQLVTSRGSCEFDDVIHNAVGTAVGVGIILLGRKLFRGEAE